MYLDEAQRVILLIPGICSHAIASLNNESLKMLFPLLPTHMHTHQSVRAAFPKYYSNPLMLTHMSRVIGGWDDKRTYIFCARVAASPQNPLHLLMCALSRCRIYWTCICISTCVCVPHICVWTFPSPCFCTSVISSLLLLLRLQHISQRAFSRSRESLYWSEVSDSPQMFQPLLSDDRSPLPQLTGSQIVFVVFAVAAAQFDLRRRKTELGDYLQKNECVWCKSIRNHIPYSVHYAVLSCLH